MREAVIVFICGYYRYGESLVSKVRLVIHIIDTMNCRS